VFACVCVLQGAQLLRLLVFLPPRFLKVALDCCQRSGIRLHSCNCDSACIALSTNTILNTCFFLNHRSARGPFSINAASICLRFACALARLRACCMPVCLPACVPSLSSHLGGPQSRFFPQSQTNLLFPTYPAYSQPIWLAVQSPLCTGPKIAILFENPWRCVHKVAPTINTSAATSDHCFFFVASQITLSPLLRCGMASCVACVRCIVFVARVVSSVSLLVCFCFCWRPVCWRPAVDLSCFRFLRIKPPIPHPIELLHSFHMEDVTALLSITCHCHLVGGHFHFWGRAWGRVFLQTCGFWLGWVSRRWRGAEDDLSRADCLREGFVPTLATCDPYFLAYLPLV